MKKRKSKTMKDFIEAVEHMDKEKIKECRIEIQEDFSRWILPTEVTGFIVDLEEKVITFFGGE